MVKAKIRQKKGFFPQSTIQLISQLYGVPVPTLKAVLAGRRKTEKARNAIATFCTKNEIDVPAVCLDAPAVCLDVKTNAA